MNTQTSGLLEKEKIEKFKEFQMQWASDPKILMLSKTGWLSTRGTYLLKERRFDDAEHDFREILELNPESITAYTALAGIYAEKKDYPKALYLLADCKKMIDQSCNEKVKFGILDVAFIGGTLELEMSKNERDEQHRLARASSAATSFYIFLNEEKVIAQSPAWLELLTDDRFIKEKHEERVSFAKTTLKIFMTGMKPEAQAMISKVL
ncbi:MAG: tetratricopeptide repeat protein [Minisyncoccia bacterium]